MSLEEFSNESVLIDGGTAGWNVAFGLAAIKTHKEDLYKYYRKLPWYESDMFDSDLQDLMEENHMVLKGSIDDIISKQLGLDQTEFQCCVYCGKRFLIKDMTIAEEFYDMNTDENDYYICDKCKNKDDNPNANQYYKDGLKTIEKVFENQ
jgi:hypothetical protein